MTGMVTISIDNADRLLDKFLMKYLLSHYCDELPLLLHKTTFHITLFPEGIELLIIINGDSNVRSDSCLQLVDFIWIKLLYMSTPFGQKIV